MNTPTVSIVIPTYNRVNLLLQTLNSLQSQTFQDWEGLVVDDGSSDDTIQECMERSEQDVRIKLIKRSRLRSGAPACRNEGTAVAQGKYLIYLDSDDCLAPFALENRVREMEQFPHLDFAIFPCMLFREQPGDLHLLWNADKEENDIDRFLSFDIPWQTMCPIWRREALIKLGEWNEELPSWQDFEFHLRALINQLEYKRFSKPDSFWRVPNHDSIGDASMRPNHLKSHQRLFVNLQEMLNQAGLLTQRRKYLLSGLYFWLMDMWVFQGKQQEAREVWDLCQKQQLISQRLYVQGIWYIHLSNTHVIHPLLTKTLRRVMRQLFKLTSPSGLVPCWSQTFRKTPLQVSNFTQ